MRAQHAGAMALIVRGAGLPKGDKNALLTRMLGVSPALTELTGTALPGRSLLNNRWQSCSVVLVRPRRFVNSRTVCFHCDVRWQRLFT